MRTKYPSFSKRFLGRRDARRSANLILGLFLSALLWLPIPGRADEPDETAAAGDVKTVAVEIVRDEKTLDVESLLGPLLDGSAPETVDQLKALELRLQQLRQRIIPCTVNVQIGDTQGSGIIISEDGYVLTAAHVGGKASRQVRFLFADGKTQARGVTLGLNRTVDAGLMKIETEGKWPFVPMSDIKEIKPGQWCVATGHPGGFQPDRPPVLRLGRVSYANESVVVSDCTLIGGDSGGPLFNLKGEVIGINSRIGEPLSLNMHVPVATFRDTWDRLVKGEEWGHLPGEVPYIGVQGTGDGKEAKIGIVHPGTPADKAGLKAGDIIVGFNDDEVKTFEDLVRLVDQRAPKDLVKLTVRRGEERIRLPIIIGKK